MKDFFKYIVLLALSIIGSMILMDLVFTFVFKTGLPRNKVQKIMQSENQRFDYAFFGSSRTENHIDCAVVEKLTGKSCINLGIAGSSIGDMLVLMKLAQRKNINFNKVFIQIDQGYNKNGTTVFLKSISIPFVKDEPVIKEVFLSEKENSFFLKIPFYRYMNNDKVVGLREVIATLFNQKPAIDLNNGFWGRNGKGLGFNGKFPKKISQTNFELEEIIDLTRNQQSEVYFFTSPYCKKAEAESYVELLENKLPNLYNYVSLFDSKQENFFDCGHLNIEGAREFTTILVNNFLTEDQSN